jgi:uncharacterized protein YjbI with pentapeptide repeats
VGLRGTDLTKANLSMSDLSWAYLMHTIFADTNLTGSKGLESCIHGGPSSIGIDTFFKSNGAIPESFLRGCGVPEQFITYARPSPSLSVTHLPSHAILAQIEITAKPREHAIGPTTSC